MASLFTHSQPAASRAAFRVEVVVEGTWLLGGDGFGTKRARLVGDALGTERARLAQGGFRGQFYKRNPLKKNSENLQNLPTFLRK